MAWISVGVGGGSLLLGGVESLFGGSKEKRAENAIENTPSPTYTPNQGVMNYYNQALSRYNTNPYQTAQYQEGIQQGNRNTAAGINALQDRGSAIGGISRLSALSNQNALNQGVAATNEQNQRFSQLGQAAGAQANEQRYGFQINKLMPYQQKLQLLGLKASAGANQENAGIQTMLNGLNSAGMIAADEYLNKQPKQPKIPSVYPGFDMYGANGGVANATQYSPFNDNNSFQQSDNYGE